MTHKITPELTSKERIIVEKRFLYDYISGKIEDYIQFRQDLIITYIKKLNNIPGTVANQYIFGYKKALKDALEMIEKEL